MASKPARQVTSGIFWKSAMMFNAHGVKKIEMTKTTTIILDENLERFGTWNFEGCSI